MVICIIIPGNNYLNAIFMRLHRFIGNFSAFGGSASGGNFALKHFKILDEEILNQIKNVLRLGKGDCLVLADGKLNEAIVKIAGMDKKFIEVEVMEKSVNKNEPEIYGALYCSILKRENFEWVCQKATECGIKEIVPVISARTVKLGFKKERLEKIIREAVEQLGRGVLPVLGDALNFKEAFEKARKNDLNLFFEINSPMINKEEMGKAGKIGIFIGPEGGWSEEELELVKSEIEKGDKFRMAGLGKLILRAETAAVVASWFVAQG
ncbi:MAG: RsmE family RNA methyltransferase [Patescibacteria group bacterium]|nr:16S rRNA (uracil(1498)-N(3))-methyltransferase [Patescibacteria group bacterium]